MQLRLVATSKPETREDCVFQVVFDVEQDHAARTLVVRRPIRPRGTSRDTSSQVHRYRRFGLTGIAAKVYEFAQGQVRLPHPPKWLLRGLVPTDDNEFCS